MIFRAFHCGFIDKFKFRSSEIRDSDFLTDFTKSFWNIIIRPPNKDAFHLIRMLLKKFQSFEILETNILKCKSKGSFSIFALIKKGNLIVKSPMCKKKVGGKASELGEKHPN